MKSFGGMEGYPDGTKTVLDAMGLVKFNTEFIHHEPTMVGFAK